MYWLIRIPLFLGQINIKANRHSLFSERHGKVPTIAFLGVRFTWRSWRPAPKVLDAADQSLGTSYLDIPFKGGHNDLSRWKRFGGTLERPAPPAPINRGAP